MSPRAVHRRATYFGGPTAANPGAKTPSRTISLASLATSRRPRTVIPARDVGVMGGRPLIAPSTSFSRVMMKLRTSSAGCYPVVSPERLKARVHVGVDVDGFAVRHEIHLRIKEKYFWKHTMNVGAPPCAFDGPPSRARPCGLASARSRASASGTSAELPRPSARGRLAWTARSLWWMEHVLRWISPIRDEGKTWVESPASGSLWRGRRPAPRRRARARRARRRASGARWRRPVGAV